MLVTRRVALFRTLFALVILLLAVRMSASGYSQDALPTESPRASIPDRVVVLTFDDSVRSHFTVVRPILKKYGFGATFFITEGFDFKTNKRHYMTWDEIAQLARDGFEIGNHTVDHLSLTDARVDQLDAQLRGIEQRCAEHGIARPVSFAWPGNALALDALPILREHGIRFARRGGAPEFPYERGRGFAYEPGLDHPLLIPSAGDARPDWELEDFVRAVQQARRGKIAVLQFHGVPDEGHPWVDTAPAKFEQYMRYLAIHAYEVIALKDVSRYVDPDVTPNNPLEVIEDRKRAVATGKPLVARQNFRRPRDDQELRKWLVNMAVYHNFQPAEIGAATGLATEEVTKALDRLKIPLGPVATEEALREHAGAVAAPSADELFILPYPGGRHPRTGFRDGAIRPQRDTKFSVFPPWSSPGQDAHADYLVADIPEAIWFGKGADRELLYLAHTHVPTIWTKGGPEAVREQKARANSPTSTEPGDELAQGQNVKPIQLEPLEWTVLPDHRGLEMERTLPNGVVFGTRVQPAGRASLSMQMWLTNGTDQPLEGLIVQNCLMLRHLQGFSHATVANKVYRGPFAACRNAKGDRWLITAWEPNYRAWGNATCPCLHSDPQFPDCQPGETVHLKGRLHFYDGTDLAGELERLRELQQRQ